LRHLLEFDEEAVHMNLALWSPKILLGTLCAALWLIVIGTGPGLAAEPAPVVLGALYNLSGSQAELDVPSSRGAQLAVDEANRSGGVLGRTVRLVQADGESRPALIAKRTAELLQWFPSVSALMGLSDTDMVLAAAPIAARHHRLFLTSGATSPRLPAQVPDYLFLACFGDNVQAAAAAEWVYRERGARTAAVFFNAEMEYARLLHQYFAARFVQLGGKVVSTSGYAPHGLAKVIDGAPRADVAFVAAGPDDALRAALLLRKAGFAGPIVGGDGFDSAAWQKHPELKDVFFTTHAYLGPDNPDPRVIAFRKAYLAAYPDSAPDAFAALGYDAVRLILAAVAQAGDTEPAEVLRALAATRHFEGVTGSLSYSAGSRIPTKSVSILGYEAGKRRLVRELAPERVPPP
jgi:branched-chain amino acid transport system substrate-binding protein